MSLVGPEKNFLEGLTLILSASDLEAQLVEMLKGNSCSLKVQNAAAKNALYFSDKVIESLKKHQPTSLKPAVDLLINAIRAQEVVYKKKEVGGEAEYFASKEMQAKISNGEEFQLKNKKIVIKGEKTPENIQGPVKEVKFSQLSEEVFQEAANKTEAAFKDAFPQQEEMQEQEKQTKEELKKEQARAPIAKPEVKQFAEQKSEVAGLETPESVALKGMQKAKASEEEEAAIRKKEEKKEDEKRADEKRARIEKEILKEEILDEEIQTEVLQEMQVDQSATQIDANVAESKEAQHRGEDPPIPTDSTSAGAP